MSTCRSAGSTAPSSSRWARLRSARPRVARRLQAKEQDLELGERVELIKRRDDGSAYDFFYDRLMIPIRDDRGRTVGFGARLLPGAEKAVRQPLRRTGSRRARSSTRTTAPWLTRATAHDPGGGLHRRDGPARGGQFGDGGRPGTATEAHARLVKRTGARPAILLFDGDEAGRKAAAKTLLGLLPLDIELRVVRIDGGQDPADVVAGAPLMEAQLENTCPGTPSWWRLRDAWTRWLRS